MRTIEERAGNFADNFTAYDSPVIANLIHHVVEDGYIKGATEQRHIDIENCVKWCENFNKNAEETGCKERIDVESFRQWITNMIMCNEQNN